MDSVRLTDGREITRQSNGDWPPLQDAIELGSAIACTICPLRGDCWAGNDFDCEVHGMFLGFYGLSGSSWDYESLLSRPRLLGDIGGEG